MFSSCGTQLISNPKSYYPEYKNANAYSYSQLRLNGKTAIDSTNIVDINEKANLELSKINLENIPEVVEENSSVNELLNFAKSFLGTRYRMGGTTKSGIDCSAFIQNVFGIIDISLPRISKDQAKVGEKIDLNEVKKGDLLFFNTRGKGVSHVAIVESIDTNNVIHFIHAATSVGVSIASLNDSYWSRKFLFAKRVL